MSLDDLARLLDRLEAGDSGTEAALDDHLRTCESCRQAVEATGAGLAALDGTADDDHPSVDALGEMLEEPFEPARTALWRHVLACRSCRTDLRVMRELLAAAADPSSAAAEPMPADLRRRQADFVAAAIVVALVGRTVVLRSARQSALVARRDAASGPLVEERRVADWNVQVTFTARAPICSIDVRLERLSGEASVSAVQLIGEPGGRRQRLAPIDGVVHFPPQSPGRYLVQLLGPAGEEIGGIAVLVEDAGPNP